MATGITLEKGERAAVTVSGDGACHDPAVPECPAGDAAGHGHNPSDCSARSDAAPSPAPQLPWGAVVGKLGSGKPFLIGHGKTVSGTGELSLLYNDCRNSPSAPTGGYHDNGGSYQVAVSVVSNKIKLSGTVVQHVCIQGASIDDPCPRLDLVGAKGRSVAVSGAGGSESTRTDADGKYEFEVRRAGRL